jgi:anaerobic selenocysteine-containing dehydrogenase
MSSVTAWQEQVLPKTLIHKAIESDEPITFRGTGAIEALVMDQFNEYTYPIPKEEGGSEIHMMWTDTPCRITCWNGGNETELAMRNPKIEFIVAQHPWLENDCIYADIILPINTYMEVDDIMTNIRQGTQQPNIMIADKAIEPIGESKSDFEASSKSPSDSNWKRTLTEGLSVFDMQKKVWGYMGGEKLVPGSSSKRRNTGSTTRPRTGRTILRDFAKFYEDPEKNPPAHTDGQAGVLLGSTGEAFPDDKERPPIPKWIEKSAMHDERLSSHRAKMFPHAADVQPRPLAGALPVRRYHLDP